MSESDQTDVDRGGSTSNRLVVNELLCFVVDKSKLMPPDSIVQLCKSFYDDKTISKAKEILYKTINDPGRHRLIKRKGPKAPVDNMKDILNTVQKCEMPVQFVAVNLSQLPAITFNDIDVSTLLANMEAMQANISMIKDTQKAQSIVMDDLRDVATGPGMIGPPPSPIHSGVPTWADTVKTSTPKSSSTVHPAPTLPVDEPELNKTYVHPAPALPVDKPEPQVKQRDATRILQKPGGHNLKAASYAKEGRPSELFVSRLDPDASCEDVKRHIKDTFNLDATVECVKATSHHTSFHVTAKCQNSRRLINPANWPEGVFLKWWRKPRDVVSDNTMAHIRMPNVSNPLINIESNEKSYSGHDQPISDKTMAGISYSASNSESITDKTMANITYSVADLIRRSDSEYDSTSDGEVPFVRSPTDQFSPPHERKRRNFKRNLMPVDTVTVTRSRSRSNLALPSDGPTMRSAVRAGLRSLYLPQ